MKDIDLRIRNIEQQVAEMEKAFERLTVAIFSEAFEFEFTGDALEAINTLARRIEQLEQTQKVILQHVENQHGLFDGEL